MPKRLMATLAVTMLLTATAIAQTATTYSQQCDATNNTSAMNGGFDLSNGNAATWNTSRVPLRKLLYPNATTRIAVHYLPWSCMQAHVDADQVSRCNGHVVTGYNSNDVTTVRNQIDDMISRGVDGVIIDYYRSTLEDETTMKVRDEAARHPNFEFAVMEDKENYKGEQNPEARAQKIVADVAYINATYFSSPAYMRRNGRPVLFVFEDDSEVNWAAVRAGVRSLGDPLLIFKNNFDHAEGDGAFAWIEPCGDPIAALNEFYVRAKVHPGKLVWGAVFPGFDDRLARWGSRRSVDRRRAQVWLDTFAEARKAFSSSNELANLQVVTHGDYDEGSVAESGIDNGVWVRGTISGTTLSWSINSGSEGSLNSFRVFTSPYPDREHWTLRAEVPAGGAHTFDLASLPAGDYEVFVQAQGQPGVRNHTSDVGHFKGGTGPSVAQAPPRARAQRPLRPVNITTPSNCAIVGSPIHVIACKSTAGKAASMQVYLDGKRAAEKFNVDCIDVEIEAAPGAHQIGASIDNGPPNLASVNVAVTGPPVTISFPESGARLLSPVRVIADENTPEPATSMQIYVDGAPLPEHFGVEHLDEEVSMTVGGHTVEVRARYAAGPPNQASVSVIVADAPVTMSPQEGAVVESPIRVLADENTAARATSMQIYRDGNVVVERFNVEHLDESVTATPGMHVIAAKAWYCDGTSNVTTVTVTVTAAVTAPVVITSPADGATVKSPFHVIACETTPAPTTVIQIYLCGQLYREIFNVECIDEVLTAPPGVCQIGVKAWYANGTNYESLITVTVLP